MQASFIPSGSLTGGGGLARDRHRRFAHRLARPFQYDNGLTCKRRLTRYG
ncbi:hypothetical protein EPYR_02475 [Erwinia pyrifoliae DSM 12163]|nr:hypothetical protein EPYR_02475 [Erwinia pyrifoliae DSM 12163]